jgi:hypothetical protein
MIKRPGEDVRLVPNLNTNGRPVKLESRAIRWVTAALALRCGTQPDATQIARATVAVWYDVSMSLKPIIGVQGITALYDRSVALTARAYPWLVGLRVGENHSVDLDELQAVIARQIKDVAIEGASELLQTFYEVLASLIGDALCEQLLGPAIMDSYES